MLSVLMRISNKIQSNLYLLKKIGMTSVQVLWLENILIPIYGTFILEQMNHFLMMNLSLSFSTQLKTLTL